MTLMSDHTSPASLAQTWGGGGWRRAPEGENETERSRLPSLQGQPAATVNEPLQSMSQQSTESLPIPNMSYIMQPSNPRLKHTVACNNKARVMGGSWLSHPRCPQKLVYFWLFFFLFFPITDLVFAQAQKAPFWPCLFVFTPADRPEASSRVLWKGQCVMGDRAARCRIVLEAGWVTEDKSGLVAFGKARPLH